MGLTEEQLETVTGILEDSVAYICEEETLSGELVWSVANALSVAKCFEFDQARRRENSTISEGK